MKQHLEIEIPDLNDYYDYTNIVRVYNTESGIIKAQIDEDTHGIIRYYGHVDDRKYFRLNYFPILGY